MATNVINKYSYDRNSVKAGILHFGVGNFHRAHLEYMTSHLLEDPTQRSWGICGAMILPSDERLYKALKEQNGEYTLTVCGRDGKNEVYRLGALVELYWGIEQKEAILDKIADPDIRIITLTITEGGYNISRQTGEFMLDNAQVAHDLANPANPLTAFGYVAEGLRRRKASGAGPITILSCDNLQHNGNTARRAFMSFVEAQDQELAAWMEKNVTFPNSMVDRITPATRPEDIERLNKENGTNDKAPVYCEDFIQWVVEDNFAAGRPAWETVGAQMTDDVTAFENMKLSLLNASHTLLSYPSFLYGYRKVDAAMHDERIAKFLDRYAAGVDKPSASFHEDLAKTREVLGNYTTYDMLGGMLLVEGEIVGFSLGEIVGDTLFTHIEKADRDYQGCYQMLVAQFAQQFAQDGVHFINREDDAGDPGLRKSKLSYHPVALLEKYTVTVDEPCKFCDLAD